MRMMTGHACRQLTLCQVQFLAHLQDEEFRDLLPYEHCLYNTEMFRDPALWRLLRDKFLPALPQDAACLWLPHETSGEDSYSLALILHEAELPCSFQILAQSSSQQRCNNIEAVLKIG